eukprot:GSChrysophyteH1.ASY1.ANO1.2961.1 assembled CDS
MVQRWSWSRGLVHATFVWLLAVLLLVRTAVAQDGFTCQGTSVGDAYTNCPDKGSQRGSAGGNVTASIKFANNLPNKDFSGPSSLVSDPYVKFSVDGKEVGRSSVIRNTLEPVWNEDVSVGFLLSATKMDVEIYDADSGVEGTDDLLVKGTLRVPFCSTFNANETFHYCGTPFGCEVDDSTWAYPGRQMCHETGIVSFAGGINCFLDGGICLFLDIKIVPFQFEVALTNQHTGAIKVTPQLGALGPKAGPKWTNDNDFQSPWVSGDDNLDLNAQETRSLRGALIMRMYQSEKAKGKANTVAWYGAVNFPATIYVCRSDEDNAKGIPTWLSNAPWSANNVSVVKLATNTLYFGCFYTVTTGTIKNKWGGVKGNSIAFGTNTIAGHDSESPSDKQFYSSHYIVVALPKAPDVLIEDLDIVFDQAGFMDSLMSYGLIWGWLAFLVKRFLKKIKFRLDRISPWLVGNVPGGEKVKSPLVGALFLSYQQTPCNVDFRGHLYHATNAMLFLTSLPLFLLIGWGISCSATVSPTSLGYAITFIGLSACFLWFGFSLWESSMWRLSYVSMASIALSITLFFCFMIATIFVDKAVDVYGHALNFSAIGTMFGTLNTVPLLMLVFEQDRTYKKSMTSVLNKMTDAVFKYRNKDRKGKDKNKFMDSATILQTLLGKCYNINSRVPLFKYAPVIYDPKEDEEPVDPDSEFEDPNANKYGNPLYNTSLVCLFVYILIAYYKTDYPSLALLNCLALIFADNIHASLAEGDNKWTPGYKIAILIVGRLIIMSSSPEGWVLNYSMAYAVYALALTNEMINCFLPILSKREAGEIAFAGKDVKEDGTNYNLASTSYFNLGLITLAFVAVLVVGAYGELQEQLPAPKMDVFGATWGVYTFGVIAITISLCGGLLMSTVRAFYLQKHGLLRGWARKGFLWTDKITTPTMLAAFTELSILCTGSLIYAMTKSAPVLILSIFIPIIIVTLGYAYSVWIKNDYILVVWPPKEATISLETHDADDLEVAFHMIENLFGEEQKGLDGDENPETDGIAEEQTLKGFKLPPLVATGNQVDSEIKMPPLPLKSVLRRKRANLGIKTKTTTIQQQSRNGADNDNFGDGGEGEEEAAAVDPWAEFVGEQEREAENKKALRKKVKAKYEMKPRGGFINHPYILYTDDYLSQYPAYLYIKKQFGQCMKFMRSKIRKWSKIKLTDDDEDVEMDSDNEDDEDDEHAHEDLTKMGFWTAVISGYLTRNEYYAVLSWFAGMLSIMVMGLLLASVSSPAYMGNVIWVALWILILTYVCVTKYFNSFVVDQTIKEVSAFLVVLHFTFTFTFFGTTMEGDIGLEGTLWIADYFFYYPVAVYMFVEFIKWREMGYVIIALDQDGDGEVTMKEYIEYFQAYPAIFIMLIVLTWQFYTWVGVTLGKICLIFLIIGIGGYFFVRDWAINDFFLSPELTRIGVYVIQVTIYTTLLVALFSSDNPIFSLSVFFLACGFREGSSIVTRLMVSEPDVMIFFSPFMFPVYSYDPKKNDVASETAFAKNVVNLLLIGAAWGASLCTFVYPIDVGILIACLFLMTIAAVVAFALSYVPQQLGKYSSMISPNGVVEAAKVARERFYERRKPLTIEMKDFEGDSIDLAIDNTSETRALTYVHDDSAYIAKNTVEIVDEFEKVHWFKAFLSKSLFSFWDMVAEAVIVGKGPLGWIGMDGKLFKLFKYAQEQPKLKFLQQPWLNAYDEFGNNKNYALLSEHIETKAILERFLDYDEAIDFVAAEESRCAIHFLILTMVSAEAKLQREQVLFQKFLRENRFRLASNGITPPAEIFTSTSYASVDIPLVAVWLSTLSEEERDRFHMLKATFSDEQHEKDLQTDTADKKFLDDAQTLIEDREEHVTNRVQHMLKMMAKKQADKVSAGEDDSIEYGRQELADIEACLKDARLGEYGRSYQFVDSDFPPGDSSIGDSATNSQVLGWRCSPGVVDEVHLFSNGSDPNDVGQGIFNNQWVLSAISMIAASGGGGESGKLVKCISDIFIGHVGLDGEMTHNTEVGGFCLRLFKNGTWIPVVVDDLLPMLLRENWTNENRGLAGAHAHEVSSIWVSLVEKSVAKFYGSYGELQKGFVHHALEDLTGAESDCILLSSASRGAGKRALWDSIIKYQSNGYIVGAGTGSSALVDKEIMEMGITFNSSYPIYSAWNIDGLKIIKLRNPPGHHEIWKGDWGLESPLWTSRMKVKLGFNPEDKDVLYMSFDDFCNVFRYLYVCKYYDPTRWVTTQLPGVWKKAQTGQGGGKGEEQDAETKKRLKAMSKVDTCGGLPSVDNPGCVLENNPHYSLKIYRPTEVRLQVSQSDSRGKVSGDALPFSILICKNPHPTIPLRLENIGRNDVVARCEDVTADRVRYLYAALKPGLYTVLVSTYVSGMEGTFTVNMISNYRASFECVWPPRWLMNQEQTSEDLMRELAKETQSQLLAKFKKYGRKATKIFRELFGVQSNKKGVSNINTGLENPEEEDSDYSDSSDED